MALAIFWGYKIMGSFADGYNFIKENAGTYAAALKGQDISNYVDSVELEIQKLLDDLNAFKGSAKDTNFLKGDVAEFWHADTFNIDAALNKSKHRMNVPRSTELGSVDVASSYGESKYSLKYYKSGEASAKAQAQSVLEGSHGKKGSDSEALYAGQYRLIPKDQLETAKRYLNERIKKEASRRPEQVARYKEALDLLRDRISDNSGSESIPLSEEDARKLADIAKKGGIKEDIFGLEKVKQNMMKNVAIDICKAGLTSATITFVLKTAPEVLSAIDQLKRRGELDDNQFRDIGTTALSSSSEGFLCGSLSAMIEAYLKQYSKNVRPEVVGAVTVIAFETMRNAVLVSTGKKTNNELTNELIKDIYVSTYAFIGGGITQGVFSAFPVFGWMLGSFLGTVIGAFAYDVKCKAAISFCVDSGFTLFGLVDQDYKLPAEVIKEIGVDVFDYETFSVESFKPATFEVESFAPDSFSTEGKLEITFLRRGVIGISKVGYIV